MTNCCVARALPVLFVQFGWVALSTGVFERVPLAPRVPTKTAAAMVVDTPSLRGDHSSNQTLAKPVAHDSDGQ